MKIFTLQEFGKKVPIPDEDKTRPTFEFKPWRMAEEKKIGELKSKHRQIGRFVREMFDFMLVKWDGEDWSSIAAGTRKLLINRMSWANVFYMYMNLRIDALGEQLKMQGLNCPSCDQKIEAWKADLNSLEVKCFGYDEETGEECDEPRIGIYQLKEPFKVGEVTVTKLRYSFTPWDAMEKIKENSRNAGAIKEAMISASYRGVDTEEKENVELQKDKVISSLVKRDIEGFYNALDEFNGGPILALEVTCDSCDKEFNEPLNWTFDYFFGNSSL